MESWKPLGYQGASMYGTGKYRVKNKCQKYDLSVTVESQNSGYWNSR